MEFSFWKGVVGRSSLLLFCGGFFVFSYLLRPIEIIRITLTATLCMLFLEVASMPVGLGVRKTFAFL